MGKNRLWVMALIMGFLLLWGGGVLAKEQLAAEQVLRFGTQYGDIKSLDPHFGTTGADMAIIKSMYNGLVRFPDGKVDFKNMQPDLAERWEIAKDYKTATFYLRKGVQWHKGFGELTSEDVKFSIERVMDPKLGSPFRKQFDNVKEIKTPDKYTVQLILGKSDPFLLLRVMDYYGGLVACKKAAEKYGKDYKNNPVGTGPFVFKEYAPKEKVVLTRNDKYFRGKPFLTEVRIFFMPEVSSRLLAFRKGEIDAMRTKDQYIEVLRKEGAKVDLPGPGEYGVIFFNLTKKPFDDIRVRRALSYGVDRQNLKSFFPEAILDLGYSPCPNGYYGHTNDVPRYDFNLAKAKELLKEAGFPNGFKFKAAMSNSETMRNTMTVLQEQWRKIGVDMELNIVDHSAYHSLIRKDANPLVLYRCTRLPICDEYMTQFFHSDSIVGKPTAITNFIHYSAVDALLDGARYETDGAKQLAMYKDAQKKIMEEAACIPLTVTAQFNGIRKPYFEMGYHLESTLTYSYTYNEKMRLLKH